MGDECRIQSIVYGFIGALLTQFRKNIIRRKSSKPVLGKQSSEQARVVNYMEPIDKDIIKLEQSRE